MDRRPAGAFTGAHPRRLPAWIQDDLRRDLAEIQRAVAAAERLDTLTPDLDDRVRRVLSALEHGQQRS